MVPPHVLKVPLACLSTVRLISVMTSHFQRHATGRSSCALHERAHHSARRKEQNERLQRFLLLSLMGAGGSRLISSASRSQERVQALSDAPASHAKHYP